MNGTVQWFSSTAHKPPWKHRWRGENEERCDEAKRRDINACLPPVSGSLEKSGR